MQQACSIIQGAAHEDANIIFGAVMDEKMKDAVKITVIATGFREVRSMTHRKKETHTSFAAAHDDAMDFPDALGPRDPMPEPVPPHVMLGPATMDDRVYVDDPAPAVATHSDRVATDVVSLDTMRSAMVTNFEQDDLDVPAFLRKRNDVM